MPKPPPPPPKRSSPPNEDRAPDRRAKERPAAPERRQRERRQRARREGPTGSDRRPALPDRDHNPPVDRIAELRAQLGTLRRELERLTGSSETDATAVEADAATDTTASATVAAGMGAGTERGGSEPAAHPTAQARALWQPPLAERDATREILTSDYFVRQWGRLGVRQRSEGRDEFGLDEDVERRYSPVLKFMFRNYFRARVDGVEQIPSEGRCLVVANHSGGPVPYDGLLLRTALRLEHPAARELRWLSEDLFHHLPWLGPLMTRLGAVRACQENAQRLLRRGHVVAVFPEGTRALGRPYQRRYRLERFGRGGFVRLCIRTQTPLVPCAIVGAEDANPLLYRLENATRFLGIPYLPITPTFPWLGPLGLIPGPAKLTLAFGAPISFDGYAPESADDELLVGRLSDRVRATIQGLLDEALARRRSVLFG